MGHPQKLTDVFMRIFHNKPGFRYFYTFVLLSLCNGVTSTGVFAQNNTFQPDTVQETRVQDEPAEATMKLDYGLNIGFYSADKSTANYYNGSGAFTGTGKQGTLEQIIGPSNSFNYPRIRQDIGYDFELHGLPTSMSYNPAMLVGLFATLQLNPKIAIMAESNFVRLKTQDQFTIKLARFSSIEGDNIERHTISGTEERIDVRLGIQYTFISAKSYIHPFIEAGLTATDTKAKDNKARIGNNTYSIYFSGTSQYFPERDFGIGIGGHATVGLKMAVNEQFKLSIGYSGHYNKINLGNNDDYGLQHSLFVRLNLNHLIGTSQ